MNHALKLIKMCSMKASNYIFSEYRSWGFYMLERELVPFQR